MGNVALTPKEQITLQVLKSLLAEHMTLDRAATLMGVNPPLGASSRPTGRSEPTRLLRATGAAERPMQLPMPWHMM